MIYIRFAFTLAFFLLFASPSSAANPTSAELMLQSQQRLTGMRAALGLDENHSFRLQSMEQDARGQTHVRFNQLYHGVRIWGGAVITHTQADGTELPPTSALKQDIKVDMETKLSRANLPFAGPPAPPSKVPLSARRPVSAPTRTPQPLPRSS